MTVSYSGEQEKAPENKYLKPRKGEGKMDEEELQSILDGLTSDAVTYVDGFLSPERARAEKYYTGEPFGNEQPGRAQVVMPEVANAVQGMIPGLIKVFTGGKHAVEFEPTSAKAVSVAEQMTDYIRYVFEQDNPGFQIIYDSLWDGLVKKTGIVKWGWEDYCTKTYSLRNLTQEQLDALKEDPNVIEMTEPEPEEHEVVVEPSEEEIAQWQQAAQQMAQQAQQMGPQGQQMQPPPMPQPRKVPAFSSEVTYKLETGKACVWSVPPEELLFLRPTADVETGRYFGHRMIKTTGELVAMGVSEEDIKEHGGTSGWSHRTQEEAIERIPDKTMGEPVVPNTGEAGDEHDYVEHYVFIDFNGDGVQELRKICTLGPSYFVVSNKVIGCRPFAMWGPYPTPHQIVARSVSDRTMDLQRVNSALVRGGLDSLAASIFPRTAFQENMVSIADVQNTEIGAGIRTKGRPADVLQSFNHTFNGKEIFTFLEYMRGEKEQRTGIGNGAAGLDMDALQSTTPDAAAEAVASNKEQVELIARIYAEQLLKPLFKGLLKLVVENQPRERVVKLRGKWTEVNPQAWDADLNVTVNVALGRVEERKLAVLLGVKQDQDTILTQLGLNAPLTGLAQAYNVRLDILRLQGIENPERYYTDPAGWQPPPPQPSPEQALAQAQLEAEKIKTLGDLAMKQEELNVKKQEIAQKYAIEQMRLQQEPIAEQQRIEAQRESDIAETQTKAASDMAELKQEFALKMAEMQQEMLMFRQKLEAEIAVEREKIHLQAQVQREAAAAKAKESPAE